MPKIEQKSKAPRILALDLLRGYFLISIILNHLQWYPSGFDFVAFRGSLLVSAAEGFFIISGILLGIVRGKKLLDQPFRVSALLVLQRGAKLYITAVVLMLAFTFIGWLFLDNPGLKPGIRPIDQPLSDILFGAFSLQYLYGWADFLRLYAIFLIMTPLALWALRKGKWYVVVLGSIGLWMLYPIALSETNKTAEMLMPLSWQLIFFIGLVIGFHWSDVQTWWSRQTKRFRRIITIPVLTFAAVTLIINAILVSLKSTGVLPDSFQVTYDTIHMTTFNKEALTLPRLILFGLWFTLGLTIFMRYETKIKQWFGWILLPFGANSLYVYILHAILIFFAHLILRPEASTNIFVNFFGSLVILTLIFIAVKKRFLFKIIPR